jgi:hypothetical protein
MGDSGGAAANRRTIPHASAREAGDPSRVAPSRDVERAAAYFAGGSLGDAGAGDAGAGAEAGAAGAGWEAGAAGADWLAGGGCNSGSAVVRVAPAK